MYSDYLAACMSLLSPIGILHLPFSCARVIVRGVKPRRAPLPTSPTGKLKESRRSLVSLKGEFDGLVGGDVDPITDRIYRSAVYSQGACRSCGNHQSVEQDPDG